MKTIRKEWSHFITLKWWQKLGTIFVYLSFLGLLLASLGILIGIDTKYQKVLNLVFFGGFVAFFLILLIFTPFRTKKPFIPDEVSNPIKRREQFEWDLGMYGLYILIFGGLMWIIHSSIKGGVPSNWMIFYFIAWVGSALLIWSPPVRKWINNYYESNTQE